MIGRLTRREAFQSLGGGFGGLALAHLLATDAAADGPRPELNGGLHHRARARRVIQLFMNGGVSQMDTFDYKPELARRHGQKFDPGGGVKVEAVTSVPGNLMKSPFAFKQHGRCGRWVSSVFPHIAKRVDEIAFLMSVRSKTNVHGPASYLMNTGFILPGFPCMGAWLSYGLGRLTDNLPTFVVLPDPRGLPYNAQGNFSAGFLPVLHQGTIIKPTGPTPIADLRPPESAKYITPAGEADGRRVLDEMNREHASRHPGDTRLESRIAAYELAAKMQLAAPEALDLSRETAAVRNHYGLDDKVTETFGRQCLTARRLVERGVRFVQVWSGAGGASKNWDNHTNIRTELPAMTAATDKPVAALLSDLRQRGLMDDTLVLWNTEFGRHPFSQGADGRDHNGQTSVQWLAGAGVRGGVAHGESDEWSWKGVKSVEVHDLHATVLHLLGIDHERLTFRHNGTNRRLTDVHGHVISDLLV
jgi:hypothetical protein